MRPKELCPESPPVLKSRYCGIKGVAFLELCDLRKSVTLLREKAADAIRSARVHTASSAVRIRRKSRALGYKHGQRHSQIECAAKLIELEKLRQSVINQGQSDCLLLALKVAEGILQKKMATEDQLLAARIKEQAKHLLDAGSIGVYIHPSQEENVREALSAELPELSSHTTADPSIPTGTARLVTRAGSIDINWEYDFVSISRGLKNALSRKQTHFYYGDSR